MKRNALAVVALLVMFPAFSIAADQPGFEGGQDEFIANIDAPSFETMINIEVPAGSYYTNATMKVMGMAAENNASAYPENVTIKLNDNIMWGFQQTGFGPLGMQDRFSIGTKQVNSSFGANGGVNKQYIRLPKDATVQSATVQVRGFPPATGEELANFSGAAAQDWMGSAVACAGDVNNDGYNDVIVGAPGVDGVGTTGAGAAYIFFGGGDMDNSPDLILRGDNSGAFGFAVSSAGDVNNDSYDDVLVGEPLGIPGKAFLFFGGANMDNTSDIIFYNKYDEDWFAEVLSSAGDVNGDGFDDIIIASRCNATPYYRCGNVFLYFGGNNMDNQEDVTFFGHVEYGFFGGSVSDAGDLNGDGFDDIVIGEVDTDTAYVYFGAQNVDNQQDLVLTGDADGGNFSDSISCVGDINVDGYSDIIVGAPYNWTGQKAGRAYIFYGDQDMDNNEDVVLDGFAAGELFGCSVHGAGDVNDDGYDDVIIGARNNGSAGDHSGSVYVFFGGPGMDLDPDTTFNGDAAGDAFGWAVSDAGDVNNDGYGDVLIGARYNDQIANASGAAYIYTCHVSNITGILNPSVSIGMKPIWKETGSFNRTVRVPDFSGELNAYLASALKSGNDSYSNDFVNVPVELAATGAGMLRLFNLSITYSYSASVRNFSSALNDYLLAHKTDKDVNGNIKIPITAHSQTAGRIRLSGLNFAFDNAPVLVKRIDDAEMFEEGWNSTFFDLYSYFQDDIDSDPVLNFSLISSTNSTFVKVGIMNKRYLAVDAMTGDANDNWTGTVEVVVACLDHWGQKTESNQFAIVVKNLNDEPLITSTPVYSAEAGVPYYYNITAVDGDNDTLRFSLPKSPAGMTIDTATGKIQWMPRTGGSHNVIVNVTDGTDSAEQSFVIFVANKAPRIISQPLVNGSTGVMYTYNVTAEDDNLDALKFTLSSSIIGMAIDSANGTITWIPEYANDYDVVVVVSDGKASTTQEFTVRVVQGNRAPKFISVPVKMGTVGLPYEYQAKGMDKDNDGLVFSLGDAPAGMAVDGTSGKVSWTPVASGNFNVTLKVTDGKGGEALQEFTVAVKDRVKPKISISKPGENEKVRGKYTIYGTAINGTLDLVGVQVRIDGGDWTDAAGNYTWQYSLDTTKLKNGKHLLEARAFDGKDYSDLASVNFTVDNQKAQGKGFIPGFEIGLLFVAVMFVVYLRVGRRRTNSGV